MHETAINLLNSSLSFVTKNKFNKLPEIVNNEYGKPFFKDQTLPKFNWSHSGKIVFLGMSDKHIGVDVEFIRERNIQNIAKRYFSESELNFIKEDNIVNFFKLWVIREAIGKYIGNGIQGFENIEINPYTKEIFYKKNSKIKTKEEVYIHIYEEEKYVYAVVTPYRETFTHEINLGIISTTDKKFKLFGKCKIIN